MIAHRARVATMVVELFGKSVLMLLLLLVGLLIFLLLQEIKHPTTLTFLSYLGGTLTLLGLFWVMICHTANASKHKSVIKSKTERKL